MKVLTKEDLEVLLNMFAIKQRLKRELRFSPEQIGDWDERDFVAVMNRSKTEGVIVAELGKLYVIPFRLTARTATRTGRKEPVICDICATWQRGSYSAIITFVKEKRSVSFLCCEDLNCSLHVRDRTSQAKLSRVHLRESLSTERRVERLHRKLQAIIQEVE